MAAAGSGGTTRAKVADALGAPAALAVTVTVAVVAAAALVAVSGIALVVAVVLRDGALNPAGSPLTLSVTAPVTFVRVTLTLTASMVPGRSVSCAGVTCTLTLGAGGLGADGPAGASLPPPQPPRASAPATTDARSDPR
jgi:hypothetical protein